MCEQYTRHELLAVFKLLPAALASCFTCITFVFRRILFRRQRPSLLTPSLCWNACLLFIVITFVFNLVVRQTHDCTLLYCMVQVNSQSGEDGAISTIRAAADPSLTGQGFKYLGPWYTQFLGAPLVIHRNNDSKHMQQDENWRFHMLHTCST